MLIKEEFYVDENTKRDKKKIYFGTSEDNITSIVTLDVPIEENNTSETETFFVLSETEEAILNTNVNVEYLVALEEMNML